MTQLNKTFERTPALIPVAGLLLAAAVTIGALAASLGHGAQGGLVPAEPHGPAPIAAPRTDRAAILSQLQSEYLRAISVGWYGGESDPILDRLHSEYLREIAADW